MKLNPNNRDTSPPNAHERNKVRMRPERTERVVQTSVQNQACDDARQKGVPVCLRPGPGEEGRGGAFCWCLSVGREGVCLFDLLFVLLVEIRSGTQ